MNEHLLNVGRRKSRTSFNRYPQYLLTSVDVQLRKEYCFEHTVHAWGELYARNWENR